MLIVITHRSCISIPVSIAPDLPSNLTITGLDGFLVSWTPPSGGAVVTGYVIYYQQVGGNVMSVNSGANEANITINGLIGGNTYSVTLVATSTTLPSEVIGPNTFTLGIYTYTD